MPDYLATLDINTLNINNFVMQNFFKGTKVTNLTRSPKVWCYTADFFLQAFKQVDSFRTRLVEVFYCVDVRVSMFVCRCSCVDVRVSMFVCVSCVSMSNGRGCQEKSRGRRRAMH
jgi:hypothetical protein